MYRLDRHGASITTSPPSAQWGVFRLGCRVGGAGEHVGPTWNTSAPPGTRRPHLDRGSLFDGENTSEPEKPGGRGKAESLSLGCGADTAALWIENHSHAHTSAVMTYDHASAVGYTLTPR
ncbi:hypothetical protein EYF80_036560 [Liparis tanakae]|uniref:Uncharacterized protein n=1 Tax=Liparis tanakae TaxID=230148 RepID=A0A4Z2GIK8_9TELE|nr:hypothetical protein EYF80_036560 [Liparis tanakae]